MGRWDNYWPCQVCGYGPCSCATASDADTTEQKDISADHVDKTAIWSVAAVCALIGVVVFSYFSA